MALKNQRFSERLAALLEEAGLTQKVFSDVIGVTQNSAGFYVQQGRVPEWNTLLRICEFFGVNVEWLINNVGPRESDRPKPPWVARARERYGLPAPADPGVVPARRPLAIAGPLPGFGVSETPAEFDLPEPAEPHGQGLITMNAAAADRMLRLAADNETLRLRHADLTRDNEVLRRRVQDLEKRVAELETNLQGPVSADPAGSAEAM
jgi:transcriptional regulator with XRE-family HTH domain